MSLSTQSDSDTIIDVENTSSASSEEVITNLEKRTRIPKQFKDFVTFGNNQSLLASVKNKSNDLVPNDYSHAINKNSDLVPNDMDLDANVPKTAREALEGPESRFWMEAMFDEINSFESCKAWTLEKPRVDSKIVGNRWVFKRKVNLDGTLLYRARLVAKGYTQTHGVDYYETYAPVVRRSTLRLLFSMAVNYDFKIAHLDVKTAFLNRDLLETAYMAQPEGFAAEGREGMVCKLNKAVYGLKQAARSWNQKADGVLKQQGFVNFSDEPCVYVKGNENSIVIIALYVDDFYLFYQNDCDKNQLLIVLQSYFKIKDLCEVKNCLGMRMERNWKNGTLLIHQEEYINSILQKFRLQNIKKFNTPMENRLKMEDVKVGPKTDLPYQELIGCLLYLSVCTRPDISYAVSFLSQFNNCYTRTHWQMAVRVVAYLKATPRLGLNYVKNKNATFGLIGYADADWAGNLSDYKSYSGYCFSLDNNLISWESKKQKLAAQSSTESEYIAVTEATKEAICLNDLVKNLFNCGDQRVTIFNDNTSAIKIAYASGFSARTKHFGVRIQLVRDCIQSDQLCLEHMSTTIMPADILTKPLDRQSHKNCCKNLRLVSD